MTGGMIVLLEMRMYGDSQIYETLETRNLQNAFTVDQILEDFAYNSSIVESAASSSYNFGNSDSAKNNTQTAPSSKTLVEKRDELGTNGGSFAKKQQQWFYYGASFSASLGQWLVRKYPGLVDGVYASSGAVECTDDNYYSDIAISDTLACSRKLALAVDLLDSIFEAPICDKELSNRFLEQLKEMSDDNVLNGGSYSAKKAVKEMFGFEDIEDDADFMYAISSVITYKVQNNRPLETNLKIVNSNNDSKKFNGTESGSSMDLNYLCSLFDEAEDHVSSLMAYARYISQIRSLMKQNEVGEQEDNTNEDSIAFEKSESKVIQKPEISRSKFGNDKSNTGHRAWLFITCNELGFFPTSAKFHGFGQSTRSSFLSKEYFLNQCNSWFDGLWVEEDALNSRFNKTNMRFGGKNVEPNPRTVYVEGGKDPTYYNSVVNNYYSNKWAPPFGAPRKIEL
ncbi:putative serine protease EDA2 [Smittium culicis]|uniref:Putative serine protease EDA2 n=1 Tax=Smittium culicis TaxID=133412 RepID=A0A1R1XAI9_9FUNG|nr:putative serine protease EDA2 [Smittium culicis]